MTPMYVKKSDPRQRVTWMDRYIASEPPGGVRDVIAGMAPDARARAVFEMIVRSGPERDRVAA